MKRFVIELGFGVDLHGGDVTKACVRAVRDAVSRSCLCGLVEICGLENLERMRVHVEVACPDPEGVDRDKVLEAVPLGRKTITVKEGGLRTPGMEVPRFGPGAHIVAACAAVTVYVSH
ncbi:MAG: Lin0512 family protein [Desulfotomaculales bacterium]